ncbi:MAG: hypothetical protein ISS52_03210 [Dehalococcoidia bacterium]|nr:hypothetical protein [Dehalococcoidia bacterium]
MTTQAKPWEPTSEQATYLVGFSRNGEHFTKHLDQIRREYAGQFIAISDDSVIRSSDDASDLLTFLRDQYAGPALSEIYITYVPTEKEVRIA